MQHMDGNTALQYVRFRNDEMGDIGRIERQQKFSKALLAKLASPAVITKLPAMISEVSAAIKTDLPAGEMLSLGNIINDVYKRGLKTDMVPGKPIYIDGISYWLPDIMAMRKQVAEIQGIAMDDKYMATARSLAVEYQNSVPQEAKVAEAPSAGQKETNPDKPAPTVAQNSTNNDKPRVEIINASGRSAYSAEVASVMSSHGFTVTGVTNGSIRKNTVVILPVTDSSLTDKLSELPFKYVLQKSNNGTKDATVTLIIGQDYTP